LPARALAVTIDDGYRDALDAAALLARHALPATVFVATGYVGAARPFWWDVLAAALHPACAADADGGATRLGLAWERLRRLPVAERERVLRRLVAGAGEGAAPAAGDPGAPAADAWAAGARATEAAGSPGGRS